MKKLKHVFETMKDKVQGFYSTKRRRKLTMSALILLLLVGLAVYVAMPKSDSRAPAPDKPPVVETDKDETDEVKDDDEDVEVDETEDTTETESETPSGDESTPNDGGTTTKPSEPTKPVTKPSEPTKPVTKPSEPDKPVTKPSEPDKPVTKPTEPQKPAHTHNWEPVYKDHPAVAAQGYYKEIPAVTKQVYYIYFGNGHKVTEQEVRDGFNIDTYAAKNNTNWWDGYETVVVTPARKEWVETSPAKPAWRELTHYVCKADGATKKP